MKLSIVYRDEVVAALDEMGMPQRAEVRKVLRTPRGMGVLNLGSSWAGKRVLLVELPDERPASRGKG